MTKGHPWKLFLVFPCLCALSHFLNRSVQPVSVTEATLSLLEAGIISASVLDIANDETQIHLRKKSFSLPNGDMSEPPRLLRKKIWDFVRDDDTLPKEKISQWLLESGLDCSNLHAYMLRRVLNKSLAQSYQIRDIFTQSPIMAREDWEKVHDTAVQLDRKLHHTCGSKSPAHISCDVEEVIHTSATRLFPYLGHVRDVIVVSCPFMPGRSGFTLSDTGASVVIGLGPTVNEQDERMTIVHELSHHAVQKMFSRRDIQKLIRKTGGRWSGSHARIPRAQEDESWSSYLEENIAAVLTDLLCPSSLSRPAMDLDEPLHDAFHHLDFSRQANGDDIMKSLRTYLIRLQTM